jgi:hypothetical protein
VPTVLYPLWPGVVASGFAASLITVLCGTLTAAIVFMTAQKLDLSPTLAGVYALLVSFSPMLFLFSTNGMSEGVASPFMAGSVCCLVLFWHGGQRRYIAASGVMLALSFACIYEAAPFGAALMFAMVVGIYDPENTASTPQGKLRAVQGLGLLFLVPAIYTAILWLIANAAIMGNPLYFATSSYSNEGYIAASGAGRLADSVRSDMPGAVLFAVVRTLPFISPVAGILLTRFIDGRLFRPTTLTLLGLGLVVPFGLILPELYKGDTFGWLRYFMYPLFVAAGWGLYEIALSKCRNLATAIVLAGWLAAIPTGVWAMANPDLGQNEYQAVRSVLNGQHALDNGYPRYFADVIPVAQRLDALDANAKVLADSSNAWTIAGTVQPATLKHKLVLTSDPRFHSALKQPAKSGIDYLLVPDPHSAPQDLLNAQFPGLCEGTANGFVLTDDFAQTGTHWRLYRVVQLTSEVAGVTSVAPEDGPVAGGGR